MFRTVPLSIIRSFSLYTQQWYMSYSLRAGSGQNCSSILILLASCQQTCMTYTIAVCTVKNSWWWTEELSETCRVLIQNKFEKLVNLVGFIVRIFSVSFRKKCSVIKFLENPSSGSRVIPCGQTDGRTDRQTDATKLIVAFCNFANTPKVYPHFSSAPCVLHFTPISSSSSPQSVLLSNKWIYSLLTTLSIFSHCISVVFPTR